MLPEGPRKARRPRGRWRDDARKDARMLGIRSWWATAMNREEWRKSLRPRLSMSCSADDNDDYFSRFIRICWLL
jgi:hypothetical protein